VQEDEPRYGGDDLRDDVVSLGVDAVQQPMTLEAELAQGLGPDVDYKNVPVKISALDLGSSDRPERIARSGLGGGVQPVRPRVDEIDVARRVLPFPDTAAGEP
jgi:hypothetical protein